MDTSEQSSLDPLPGASESTHRVPVDIIMSLLRPGELEKLRRYITAYIGKVRQRRQTAPLTQEE
jgi:hypothetical protein